jgi:hypothetical protein
MRRWCCSLLSLLPLAGWADGDVITRVLHQNPTPQHFEHCQGGGCAEVETVALSAQEWQPVRAIFDPPATDAEAERKLIAQAVGMLERIVGPKTGTATDRAGTFGNSGYPGQLDCNDESTNSTTYMRMMAKDGLLHFHEVVDTKTRGFFFNGWPHTTAVIREIASGRKFAVDSWFYDNGVPAVVLPLEVWQGGWRPADSPAN